MRSSRFSTSSSLNPWARVFKKPHYNNKYEKKAKKEKEPLLIKDNLLTIIPNLFKTIYNGRGRELFKTIIIFNNNNNK
jgi:hypothetical protein